MEYFIVMIDYGRRGREAIVDPEITRREVLSRIASGEYKDIAFIHRVRDCTVEDVTAELTEEAAVEADRACDDAIERIRAARLDHQHDLRKNWEPV